MPRIRFTSTPKLPRDIAHLGYTVDQEIDGTADWCERWVRRGVAQYVSDPVAQLVPLAVPVGQVVAVERRLVEPVSLPEETSVPPAQDSFDHPLGGRRGSRR